jgi:uncharacterized protein YecE (DUF72 family)
MKTIYAATSGWAYTTWKPDFYPAKLSSAKFLNYYARRLNSVEVNYRFRSTPTEKLLMGWMAETPLGFKFAIKANQTITHIKRLRSAAKVTSEFIDSLLPLREADQLGPVLFQLPPNLKCDLPFERISWRDCLRTEAAHLNFDTILGFKTASSQYYAKQRWRCVARRAKNWRRLTSTPLIFFICGCGRGNTQQGSEVTQTESSKACS